ncbi:MAG: DUF1987 domain-containing protein [Bacteroidia bacterium]|nr:DUF1987 domain-containing protein [Bacteroidia bacterium]
MKTVYIKSTNKTPEVNMDLASGEFKIAGRSIAENPKEFYEPIIREIENYAEKPKSKSVFEIYFEYLSTASTIFVMKILTALKKLSESGKKVELILQYDDDDTDMLEKFQAMSQIVNVDARFQPVAA